MRLLILLSIFIFTSCGEKLPSVEVRSLSGKDYHGPNARVGLIHDFKKGAMFLISHSIKAPGGMFFTSMDFGLTAYGSELYFFDDETGTSHLVADIEPGRDSSRVSNFSDPGGDWIYFLASTKDRGREIHRVNKTTFVVEELPEGEVGSDDSFKSCDQKVGCFIVTQESPLVAYGKIKYNTGSTDENVLFEYKYDGSSVSNYGAVVTAASNPGDMGDGEYLVDPKMMRTMFGNLSSSATPMLVLSEENDIFAVRLPNNDLIEYSHILGDVEDIQILRDGGEIIKAPIMIAQPNGGGAIKLWVYTYNGSTTNPIKLESIYNVGTNYLGTNVKEMTIHNEKLYFVAEFFQQACTDGIDNTLLPVCVTGGSIGEEIGIYDPIGYEYWETKGFEVIDLKVGTDDSEPSFLTGAGVNQEDDKLCFSGWDGSDGMQIHCINGTENQPYVDGVSLREMSYTTNEHVILGGSDHLFASFITYLNGSLVFQGRRDTESFGLYHLNLSTGVHKMSGPAHPLFDNGGAYLASNRYILHSSHKHAFEITLHDLLGGQMINDQGEFLFSGMSYKKTEEFTASTNDTGLPLLRFITPDGLLYGSAFLNQETSWTYNESTRTHRQYNIGGIISKKYLEHNGRVYFSVNHRQNAAIAWINPSTGESNVIQKSCEDSNIDEFCKMFDANGAPVTGMDNVEYFGVGKSLRLLMVHKDYIYYVAEGDTDLTNTLYRYNPANDEVKVVQSGLYANIKLLYSDENIFIISGLHSDTSKYLLYSNDSLTLTTIQYGGFPLTDYQDHYVEEDKIVVSAFRNDGATGYGLLKFDISDTSTFSSSDVTLLLPTLEANPDSFLLAKDQGELLVIRKNSNLFRYRKQENDAHNLSLVGPFTTNVRGKKAFTLKSNVLTEYNVYGTAISSHDLSLLNVTCTIDITDFHLMNKLIIEHCSDTKFVVHLRSNNQKIDLTSFDMGWDKDDTRYKVLLESEEKTVISFMKIDSGPDDIVENKIIEFDHANNAMNFVYDDSMDISKLKIEEGKYLSCGFVGGEYPQIIQHDFITGEHKAISGEQSCIGVGGFDEVMHIHDGYFKGLLKYENFEKSLGYELYRIKL